MSEFHPIVVVDPSWRIGDEPLGSKEKFWFRRPEDERPWLFKHAREGTGEAWSEKVAAETAALLGIPAAKVELAVFGNARGCASRSIVDSSSGDEMVHGNEVLAGRVLGYDRNKKRRQSDHCVPNIVAAIRRAFPRSDLEAIFVALAGHATLDAVIGNTDRHHENWAILRTEAEPGVRLAPSYDHASSLGRELTDDRRRAILAGNRVPEYVARGRGGIYWRGSDERGENPLRLVVRAMGLRAGRPAFADWLDRLAKTEEESMRRALDRIPPDWASDDARALAFSMMEFARTTLLEARA